ncbi:MAG: NrsF family protein [Pseudolabrys sp.]
METDKLIQKLAAGAGPVRPLASPWARTALWLAVALPYIALVVAVISPRADLLSKLADARFLIEQIATLATGIAAAMAAFASTVPGYDRKVLLLPAAPLALWLGSLGEGCLRALWQHGLAGLSLQPDWFCLPAIMLVGAMPAVAMVIMLRRGAPLFPYLSAGFGALAAAGLGNFGLRLFHPQDASLMVLVWQVGSVFILTMIGCCAGRNILNWHRLVGDARG